MHLSVGQLRVVLILALLQDLRVKPQRDILQEQFEKDLLLCPACFAGQREQCEEIFGAIAEPSDWSRLLKSIALLFDRRQIYWLEFNEKEGQKRTQLVGKRKALDPYNFDLDFGEKDFLQLEERAGGFHLCRIPRFVTYLEQRNHSSASIWFYVRHNVSPLLTQELHALDFPVPRTYGTCGLTHFQAHAGRTLTHYAEAEEAVRLEMARQVLQLSLKLTFGFADFRIYLTDFTADNLAYDEASEQVILIDVDSVVLVDAATTTLGHAQKYEPLPGEGFTFDVSLFCSGQQVDANVYQACLLIRDSLRLKDVANERLQLLLEQCVLCQDEQCDMRFQYAYDLIKLLDS